MLFNSLEFLIFLPVVFALYWFVFKGRRLQNLLVVVASYVFYGWWDWRFLTLIALTSASSFASGWLIERFEGRPGVRRGVSAANITLNLGILATFKYYNFFVDNLNAVLGLLGCQVDWVTLNLVLPVGISFYTFQALSYSIDVYRGDVRATHDPVEFFAYISFFPQLVAGPIERATRLLPQFQRERHFDYARAVDGLRQMLWGLFKKLIVADNCASVVNMGWNNCGECSGLTLLSLGVLFTLQIYGDFSGYSDMAIGCARLFGIDLMRNFNVPYFSRTIPEFWRRWHISLMTWFRDYVYIPLGGNRRGRARTIANVFIVWGLSGLWHGADWTFVTWGLYHAALIALCIVAGVNTKQRDVVAAGRLLPGVRETLQMILTFALVVIGWIIFRCESMEQAGVFLTRLFTAMGQDTVIAGKPYLLYGLAMLAIEWLQRDKQHALQLPRKGVFRHAAARYATYASLVVFIFLFTGKVQTFIYFQF